MLVTGLCCVKYKEFWRLTSSILMALKGLSFTIRCHLLISHSVKLSSALRNQITNPKQRRTHLNLFLNPQAKTPNSPSDQNGSSVSHKPSLYKWSAFWFHGLISPISQTNCPIQPSDWNENDEMQKLSRGCLAIVLRNAVL